MLNKKNDMAVRTALELSCAAKEIMTITLVEVVPTLTLLFTALYLSKPEEAALLLKLYPNSVALRETVDEVILYHTDLDLLADKVADGFFASEVEELLKIARGNRLYGARLIPVFCAALMHADELGIPVALQETIRRHIKYQRELDGFVIVSTAGNCAELTLADDVDPI